MEDQSTNTEENMIFTKNIMDQHAQGEKISFHICDK
ncbi:YdcF family protein [Lysinibacillus sp. MHQ-1]|nr:YdcF family protein [Lysinibacillus sp. MHQ-1]